jgi:hypothetical protein
MFEYLLFGAIVLIIIGAVLRIIKIILIAVLLIGIILFVANYFNIHIPYFSDFTGHMVKAFSNFTQNFNLGKK